MDVPVAFPFSVVFCSLIFWGPPGVGKTTIANIIAARERRLRRTTFVKLSAVSAGLQQVRDVINKAKSRWSIQRIRTILFIDEIHRFNKLQQDVFLPFVENGTIILLGATTENPSFELNNALLSRAKVIVLEKLSADALSSIVRRAIDTLNAREERAYDVEVDDKVVGEIVQAADGDGRAVLNVLETAIRLCAQSQQKQQSQGSSTTSQSVSGGAFSVKHTPTASMHPSALYALSQKSTISPATTPSQSLSSTQSQSSRDTTQSDDEKLSDSQKENRSSTSNSANSSATSSATSKFIPASHHSATSSQHSFTSAKTQLEQSQATTPQKKFRTSTSSLQNKFVPSNDQSENSSTSPSKMRIDSESVSSPKTHTSDSSLKRVPDSKVRTRPVVVLRSDHLKTALLSKTHFLSDRAGDQHYELISALHKSVRGCDANAALYWLGRLLEGGEKPLYVARRLIRMASEDIGLADPQALVQATTAFQACHMIGFPECNVILAQAVTYMALAPKSNALEVAYNAVKACVAKESTPRVPIHLRCAPTSLMKSLGFAEQYLYNHDCDDYAVGRQTYLPPELEGRTFLPDDIRTYTPPHPYKPPVPFKGTLGTGTAPRW